MTEKEKENSLLMSFEYWSYLTAAEILIEYVKNLYMWSKYQKVLEDLEEYEYCAKIQEICANERHELNLVMYRQFGLPVEVVDRLIEDTMNQLAQQ